MIQPTIPNWSARLSPFFSLLWFGFRTLMLAALAVLVVIFWPEPTLRVARAAVAQPFAAGGLGLLTQIIGIPALILLLITILFSPLSFLGLLLLLIAGVFGWVALGLEVGRRLGHAFNWDMHPAAEAGIGGFLMTLVIGGFGLIPCVGWVAPFVLVCIGLGAVLLTRFGSRDYEPAVAIVEAPKPAPRSRRTSSGGKS